MAAETFSELVKLLKAGEVTQDEYATQKAYILRNMHETLASLLEKREFGHLTEQQYESERQRILEEEIGIGVSTPVAPAPKIGAVAPIISAAELKRQEESRLQALLAQNKGKLSSYVPSAAPKATYVRRSQTVMIDGEPVHKILTSEEQKAFLDAERKAAEQAVIKPAAPLTGNNTSIPIGYEVKGGVIRPPEKAKSEPDPRVEEIRKRWKAGEFGQGPSALATAQKLIKELQADRPVAGRIDCSVCKGKSANDKIIGKLCRCGGKGFLAVDVEAAAKMAAMGCGAVDPVPESPDAVSYTAYLTDGRRTTIHADSGQKAIRGACESLRASATGFERITLDQGCMLVLPVYETLCAACHGSRMAEGRTCTQCENGRIVKHGGRFYFKDSDKGSAADQAHEAGLQAMTDFDPERTCGKKKCKGKECRACYDARQGGFQFPGFVPCTLCKGSGRGEGEEGKCEKCRGHGRFIITQFAWIQPTDSFSISNEIRRVDLLIEDRAPKRDRNIKVRIGDDLVEVGPGKVPSRKSGAVCALSGTRRNKYDSANSKPDGLGYNMRVREFKATFSGG